MVFMLPPFVTEIIESKQYADLFLAIACSLNFLDVGELDSHRRRMKNFVGNVVCDDGKSG